MGTSGAGTSDVAGTVREMWATRPARRDADRKIAGVAGALARRYAIDPTLVRVAFVVLALTGGGVLLYLAGWIALPADPADRPRRDRHHGGPPLPVLVLTAIVGLLTLSPAGGRLASLVGLALAAVLLYALHTSGRAPAVEAPAPPTPPTSPTATGSPASTDTSSVYTEPPAWDPLGAAPFAWDLPTPAPKADPAPERSRHTPVTLALALLVAGALGGFGLLGVVDLSATAVLASALAVVGLGLVVGAFRHRGRGLVVAAVPLVVLTVLSAGAGLLPADEADSPVRGVGDVRATPALAALVAPEYRSGLGDVDLDLRALAGTSAPVTTTVTSGAGDVGVLVPRDATVRLTCRTGVGDVDCLGRSDDLVGLVDPGVPPPGATPPVIDLTVSSGAGDVEVRRG